MSGFRTTSKEGHTPYAMSQPSHEIERFVAPGNSVATLAVTVAAILAVLFSEPRLPSVTVVAVVALAIVHALLGTVVLYFLERRGTRRQLAWHFAIAVAVVATALITSRGLAGLLGFSLVSQSLLYLARTGAFIVTSATSAAVATAIALRGGGIGELFIAMMGWAAGAAFVLVFSAMMLRQQRARRELERLAGELAAANDRLRTYAGEIEELVSVNERNRIARDIHDTVGHCLTVIHVQLEAADANLESSPAKARSALEKARQLAHEGLGEVRRSVALLRGASPAYRPITASIERLAREAESPKLAVEMRVHGSARPLAEPVECTLYRAAQEALTNVRRHAEAQRVDIELDFTAKGQVELRIKDDGVGSANPSGGMGLVGIRERAELVGGTAAIDGSSGTGFGLAIVVPG